MLGTLSKFKDGIEWVNRLHSIRFVSNLIIRSSSRLLEKFKVFTAFYHLSELRSREDLIKGIIENLDYSMFVNDFVLDYILLMDALCSDGHPRIVLSKALTSSYKVCSFFRCLMSWLTGFCSISDYMRQDISVLWFEDPQMQTLGRYGFSWRSYMTLLLKFANSQLSSWKKPAIPKKFYN